MKAALLESGLYTLATAENTQYVLDVSGASLSYGGNVQAWESNGTNAQKFFIQQIGDNLYSITNAWSALALDVAGRFGSGWYERSAVWVERHQCSEVDCEMR